MRCAACGERLNPGDHFCAACGQQVEAQQTEAEHRETASPDAASSDSPNGVAGRRTGPVRSVIGERRNILMAIGAAVLAIAVVGGIIVASQGSDKEEEPPPLAAETATDGTTTKEPAPLATETSEPMSERPLLINSADNPELGIETNSLAIVDPLSSTLLWSRQLAEQDTFTVSPAEGHVVIFAPGDAVESPSATVIDLLTQTESRLDLDRFPALDDDDLVITWSPDGSYLAFQEEETHHIPVIEMDGPAIATTLEIDSTAQGIWNWDLVSWSTEVNGKHELSRMPNRLLACDAASDSAVVAAPDDSEDNQRLPGCDWLWAQSELALVGVNDSRVATMNPDNGNLENISGIPSGSSWEIVTCPAYSSLGYDATFYSPNEGVYVADVSDEDPAANVGPDDDVAGCDLAFSAAEKFWATLDQERGELLVGTRGSQGEPVVVNQPGTAVDGFTWVGKRIVFHSDGSLFVVDPDGENGQKLDTPPVSDPDDFHYFPDQERLVVGVAYDTGLYPAEEMVVLDTRDFTPLGSVNVTRTLMTEAHASNDGKYFAVRNDISGFPDEIVVTDMETVTSYYLGEGVPLGWVPDGFNAVS